MPSSNFIRDLLYDGNLNPLVKPDINFGNYFFKWDEKSLGLYSDEILKFKIFIKNMIPYLETLMKMFDTSTSIKKIDTSKTKILHDKVQFSISDKYNSYIIFTLNIDNTGSTILFREERILINDELYNKMQIQYGAKNLILLDKLKNFNDILSVKWKLGDLLFNRSRHK
jgi:hypothetical protein